MPDGYEWTLWDALTIAEDTVPTLGRVLDWLRATHRLDVSMVSHGSSMLYNAFLAPKKSSTAALTNEEKRGMPVDKLVERITGRAVSEHVHWLTIEVLADDAETGEEVEVPCVKVALCRSSQQ